MEIFNGRLGQVFTDLVTIRAAIFMLNQIPAQQKFFIYARKSTDNEEMQVLSIEAQLAELREFAKKEGLSVCQEFIEKQSAKTPGRPIFNDMLTQIGKGLATGILSWHPDRLARNSIDGGKILYLVDCGLIKSLRFPSFWFEPTAQGKFMLSLAFGQSKYYVDSLSENTKRGLRQKVRRGEMPGLAPIGYLNDRRTKEIVIDKKLSLVIIKCFEMFATGNFLIKEVAHFLSEQGIKTATGKTKGSDWVSHLILSNPFYYGYFRYQGEIHQGIHKPIITKKLFDDCQIQLAKRTYKGITKEERVAKPFLGLFRCGECGMMVTGEQKTKYYKRTDRHATYTYYRCTKKSKTHLKCFQPFIRQEELDKQLSQLLQKVSLPQEVADNWLQKLEKEKSQAATSCLGFVQEKRNLISELKTKIQSLTDIYLDQDIEREEYLEKKNFLISQKKTLEEEILSLEQNQNAWLGPFREWILGAAQVSTVASGTDLNAKKVLALDIFGSNLILENSLARGEVLERWAALRAAPTIRNWERVKGIEPSVFSLGRKRVADTPHPPALSASAGKPAKAIIRG